MKLCELSELFLSECAHLAPKTQAYYLNGIRLLTPFLHMELAQATKYAISHKFTGSASNANNALRTLGRIGRWALAERLVADVPKVKLRRENRRELLLDEVAEARVISQGFQPLNDVLIIMREMGMRNNSEILAMRWENVRFEEGLVLVPGGKTGRRFVPLTDRVARLLRARGPQVSGWVFPSNKGGHTRTVAQQWRKARLQAKLSPELVPYCARHDFGTYALEKSGNLAAVMKVMGHTQVSTAMRYQHPKIDCIREVMNRRAKSA